MFGPNVAPNVKPMQINESAVLMHDFLTAKDPSEHHRILRRYVSIINVIDIRSSHLVLFRYSASVMFYLAYGRRVRSLEDPLCVEHDKVEKCEYPPMTVKACANPTARY